jgi:hypothetical protein
VTANQDSFETALQVNQSRQKTMQKCASGRGFRRYGFCGAQQSGGQFGVTGNHSSGIHPKSGAEPYPEMRQNHLLAAESALQPSGTKLHAGDEDDFLLRRDAVAISI